VVSFRLVPFPGDPVPAGISVEGSLERDGERLTVRHGFAGALPSLSVPRPAPCAERRNALWEDCCLELFLAEADSPGYREFNLSPAGHWNVWRFDGCRAGMREDDAFDSLPFRVDASPDRLVLTLDIDLGRMFPPARPLSVGVSAVVLAADGRKSHWALAHPAARPDFHRRDAFTIRL
jgi:hypothetical protein